MSDGKHNIIEFEIEPLNKARLSITGIHTIQYHRLPLCAGLVGTKNCAGPVWSISTLHAGPPGLTLTLTPALWGVRGRQVQLRGSAVCFGGVFSKQSRAAERRTSTNKTNILHKVLCRPVLHIGRVNIIGTAKEMQFFCVSNRFGMSYFYAFAMVLILCLFVFFCD